MIELDEEEILTELLEDDGCTELEDVLVELLEDGCTEELLELSTLLELAEDEGAEVEELLLALELLLLDIVGLVELLEEEALLELDEDGCTELEELLLADEVGREK